MNIMGYGIPYNAMHIHCQSTHVLTAASSLREKKTFFLKISTGSSSELGHWNIRQLLSPLCYGIKLHAVLFCVQWKKCCSIYRPLSASPGSVTVYFSNNSSQNAANLKGTCVGFSCNSVSNSHSFVHVKLEEIIHESLWSERIQILTKLYWWNMNVLNEQSFTKVIGHEPQWKCLTSNFWKFHFLHHHFKQLSYNIWHEMSHIHNPEVPCQMTLFVFRSRAPASAFCPSSTRRMRPFLSSKYTTVSNAETKKETEYFMSHSTNVFYIKQLQTALNIITVNLDDSYISDMDNSIKTSQISIESHIRVQ